jgi:hypothetical protein
MKRRDLCYVGVLAAIGGFSMFAAAQERTVEGSPTRRIELPVQIDNITNLRVTSLGRVNESASPYAPRACNVTSSLTDANFGGGSFTAQAGMGEGESFAATYVVPAAEWPIKIDLAEVLFVTSNATVATTTRWSIAFYQGNPQTGTQVFSEASDDVILPYVRIPAGTRGVNLQFSIDPQDPDQIIIQNNGSNQFSIEWSIDRHNQQTANPCVSEPPSCCNAFMATDVSGLQNGAANWLFGLNCGIFGCPPNGGWSRFNNLNILCRPTGDVVTRVTWSSVSCQPGLGACCLEDGSCIQTGENECFDQNGVWRGEFSGCAAANCPAPTGACCLSNGNCLVLTPANCTVVGGTYLGNDSVCGAGSTCPLGACCLPNGTCASGLTEVACATQNGSFRGVGSSCVGSTCPTGRCCLPSGECQIATQVQCTFNNGIWGGANTTCGTACPQPTGACCLPTGCIVLTSANCGLISGGVWAGPNSTCADLNSDGTADACASGFCAADYNEDGGVDGGDVESFFIDWAQAVGNSDVNQDGGVDGGDVESFFIVWAAGGC